MMGNSAPVARVESDDRIMPIAALNLYNSKWTIKARVTSKSAIRRWSNARGEGHLFNVDLLDGQGGEIRATFFKDACDRFEPLLQEGRVYTFSGGRLKLAKKEYTSIKNDYEITFDRNADIRPSDDEGGIKRIKYNFTKIGDIEKVAPGATIDLVAVVKSCGECNSIMSQKLSKELFKRDLVLVDDSNTEIQMTLWGDRAREDGGQWMSNPVIAVKGVKVSDYNGRSLSLLQSSNFSTDTTDSPEAGRLRQWWSANQGNVQTTSISAKSGGGGAAGTSVAQRQPLSTIKDEGLGTKGETEYLAVKGTVTLLQTNGNNDPWYTAAPEEGVLFKVTETTEGQWFCERNGKTYDTCKRRFVLSLVLTDYSGNTWVTAFNDPAELLLGGKTADECYEMRARGDEQGYKECFSKGQFKQCIFKLRVKTEQLNDEQRVKTSIVTIRDVNYKEECRQLIEEIAKF